MKAFPAVISSPAWFASFVLAAVTAALLLAYAPAVHAFPEGITGSSGKQLSTCAECHEGGTPPQVSFVGPDSVAAGTQATFLFIVQAELPNQVVAGFNVAASSGQLGILPDQGERAESGEITHEQPKPNTDGKAVWKFKWRAPRTPGMEILYGAGVSANNNGTDGGDDVNTTTLSLFVGPQPGDANCDERLSAADLTAVALLQAGSPDTCPSADADCDQVVDENDATLVVAALFGVPPSASCDQVLSGVLVAAAHGFP